MRHRPLALLLLLSTLTFSLVLYLRLRTYDLVSAGLCRVAPFSPPCLSSPHIMQTPSSVLGTHRVHKAQGSVSLSIGSLNIRFSRDTAYDSTQSMLSSLENLLAAARGGRGPATQFAPSIGSDALSAGSPYLMRQYHGERSWLLRGPKVADVALFNDWDLFAFQEVLDGQYSNLVHWLGDEYDHAGVGRDDGERAGEAVPVFWRRDTFERVNKHQGGVGEAGVEHFWLSPTPGIIGSVGWDAALTRMCTHVSLRFRATGEIIHVFSTHYDHQGVLARAKSSELILHRARLASAHTQQFYRSHPHLHFQPLSDPLVVLIGDLNSPRNEGSWSTLVSPHYGLEANSSGASFLDTALSVPTRVRSPFLSDNEDPHRSELASGRKVPSRSQPGHDQRGLLSEPVGPLRTFTDFQPSSRTAIDDRIDFIMLLDNHAVLDQTRTDARLDHHPSPPPPARDMPHTIKQHHNKHPSDNPSKDQIHRWRIRSFGTLPNWSEADAGFLISDHRPVMTRIQRTIPPLTP